MTYDKYGLEWGDCECTSAAPADAEPAPLKTLHSSSNRNTKEKKSTRYRGCRHILVLVTENLVGRKIDVELSDADFDFE